MAECYASTIVNLALNEVGYLEKKSNTSLFDKTKNAGNNNYTKYAYELDEIKDFYNGKKNGYAWCSCFVDNMGVKAFGVADMKRITFHTIYGASCTYSARQYKNNGRFYTTPKVGDEIFFKDSDGGCSHTGLVVAVDTLYVHTVEGNTSSASGVVANGGAVEKKKYLKTYNKIYGYGRPLYDAEPKKKKYSGKFPKLPKKGYLAKGDKGTEVEKLQAFLNWYGGYKLVVDGDFGAKTHAAVVNFQSKEKLDVDGLFGKNSLARAKKVKK